MSALYPVELPAIDSRNQMIADLDLNQEPPTQSNYT